MEGNKKTNINECPGETEVEVGIGIEIESKSGVGIESKSGVGIESKSGVGIGIETRGM